MPSSDAPLLEVNDLATHYGPIQAIHSVSLEVHPGELVAIVGANGAGKTTLLRTISGIQAASGGSIRFDGEEITRLAAHKIVARGVCQVPEGRQMFAPLSVDDNLRLGGYSQRKDGGWVEEKIRDYPLAQLENLVRSVTEQELKLIVRLGYVLGGVIGTILVGITWLLG